MLHLVPLYLYVHTHPQYKADVLPPDCARGPKLSFSFADTVVALPVGAPTHATVCAPGAHSVAVSAPPAQKSATVHLAQSTGSAGVLYLLPAHWLHVVLSYLGLHLSHLAPVHWSVHGMAVVVAVEVA